jgi:hypothetical protein
MSSLPRAMLTRAGARVACGVVQRLLGHAEKAQRRLDRNPSGYALRIGDEG